MRSYLIKYDLFFIYNLFYLFEYCVLPSHIHHFFLVFHISIIGFISTPNFVQIKLKNLNAFLLED